MKISFHIYPSVMVPSPLNILHFLHPLWIHLHFSSTSSLPLLHLHLLHGQCSALICCAEYELLHDSLVYPLLLQPRAHSLVLEDYQFFYSGFISFCSMSWFIIMMLNTVALANFPSFYAGLHTYSSGMYFLWV